MPDGDPQGLIRPTEQRYSVGPVSDSATGHFAG